MAHLRYLSFGKIAQKKRPRWCWGWGWEEEAKMRPRVTDRKVILVSSSASSRPPRLTQLLCLILASSTDSDWLIGITWSGTLHWPLGGLVSASFYPHHSDIVSTNQKKEDEAEKRPRRGLETQFQPIRRMTLKWGCEETNISIFLSIAIARLRLLKNSRHLQWSMNWPLLGVLLSIIVVDFLVIDNLATWIDLDLMSKYTAGWAYVSLTWE